VADGFADGFAVAGLDFQDARRFELRPSENGGRTAKEREPTEQPVEVAARRDPRPGD
jgi:hypothetical protein